MNLKDLKKKLKIEKMAALKKSAILTHKILFMQ